VKTVPKEDCHGNSKSCLHNGANKGIGFETARGLAGRGITVVLGCRDETRGRAALERLKTEGFERAEVLQFDVTRPEDHRRAYAHIEQRYGKLDILVNNAAIVRENEDFANPVGFNTTTTVAIDILRETFETNFFAVVALTQLLLPLIRKSPAGRIVNLSSSLGSLTLHSDPSSPIYKKKAFAYDASKTVINAFTVHLAQALRSTKIKVNSADPGWVRTDMGGSSAALEVTEGGKTSVELATLTEDGPTGGYFHQGQTRHW
jgi:NAD(P)-dependent dehydrogenase (short-subunit alcohol dehydrogenase family)